MSGVMKFDQIEPGELESFAADPRWWMQQKLDGMRAQVHIGGGYGGVRVIGIHETEVQNTTHRPAACALIETLESSMTRAQDWELILDCEIVDGVFWAFDLPRLEGMDERAPLRMRLVMLDRMKRVLTDHSNGLLHAVPTARSRVEKKALVEAVRGLEGSEGIMVKRWDGTYDWGRRVRHTLKAKFRHTVDCVVLERGPGNGNNGHGNWMRLGVYRPVDGLDERGGIKVGPSTEITHELVEIGRCSTIGKPYAGAGDVVEVGYLYAGAGGRLVQPSMWRVREDKRPEECTSDQLRFVNKHVIQSVA